jgi:hypothetical protein
MLYQLSFLDSAGRIRAVREADFETDHNAMRWMWIAAGVEALYDGWSTMELWCQRCCSSQLPCPRRLSGQGGCCIARVPAKSLKHSSNGHHGVNPVVIAVDSDAFDGMRYESLLRAAGFPEAVVFLDDLSAEQWLRTHRPDAAIIEARPGKRFCAPLAQTLAGREIPFLVVSYFPPDMPGADRVLRSAPWLAKPVTPEDLELALSCMI